MKLVKLKLKNFRCYQETTEISFDDLTAIIGRNDIGKSSIMDALAIFFEEAKIEKADGCVYGTLNEVQITCEFANLPSTIIIDETASTTLTQEHLVNGDGNLEIRKTYDCSIAGAKLASTEAVCLHPSAEGYADLLKLKRTELVARARELAIDLTGTDQRVNAQVRAAIWAACPNLAPQLGLVSLEKEEGAKQIWNAMSKHVPAFALFKSDRASSDQDSEAQDPLKAAIKDALKNVETQLREIQEQVEAEVKKIADATVEKIQEMDPSLASTLDPIITTKKWDTLFQTSITGDHGIPLNKRGSGVRRLVLLNFFRAKAEKAAMEKSDAAIIYAIEEPETSQHPHNQRMLMSALVELTASSEKQVIVTTHTPMLARGIQQENLRFIEKTATGGRVIVSGGNDTTNRKIAESLGVLPDHSVKLFIGVEGKHDISFLKGISKMLATAGENVPDLEALEIQGEVVFFPFGGSNLALWASRLSPLNRPEFHLCDRDIAPPAPAKYAAHVTSVNAREGCKALSTAKRETENYLHHDAVSEAYADFGINLVFAGAFGNFEDVPESIAKAVHSANGGQPWGELSQEKKDKKVGRAKIALNSTAISKMTPERLTASDPDNEVRGWLEDIKNMLEGNAALMRAA